MPFNMAFDIFVTSFGYSLMFLSIILSKVVPSSSFWTM